MISAPGGSIGFSAFTGVSGGSGGALVGFFFFGISMSGTVCGVSRFSFFSGFSVVLITVFASLN